MVRKCWVNFQCRGVLQIWIIVGQGPTALAEGAVGVWTFFLPSIISLSLLLEDGPIWTEIKYINPINPINEMDYLTKERFSV